MARGERAAGLEAAAVSADQWFLEVLQVMLGVGCAEKGESSPTTAGQIEAFRWALGAAGSGEERS